MNEKMQKVLNKFKSLRNTICIWTDSHFGKVKTIWNKFINYKDVRFVLFLYLIAFIMFGQTLIYNSFTIPVSGDFVIQEIPFYYNGYDDWWTAIRTGEFPLWDESAMLGVNNIGANTFYYLFNIFFLPTLLFPRSWIPQVQAFLIITKFVLAGYFMKKLLDIFSVKQSTSKMVAVAYAFSGWSMFYLWFNHFLEVAVLFPIVLIGIEKCLREQKPIYLTIALFVSAMTNYFFFISFCFTTVMYALFRYFQFFKGYTKEEKVKSILYGVLSYVIAICMALVILVPAFKSVLSNPRVESATYSKTLIEACKSLLGSIKSFNFSKIGKDIASLFKVLCVWSSSYWKKYIVYPFSTFFFPTISCYNTLLFANTGYDNTLSSLFIYTPLMLLLIPSIINSLIKKKFSHIFVLCGIIILLITPFAYYCFSGFTSVAYGRWQLFVCNIMCIYVAINIDKEKEIKGWSLDISILVCLISQFAILKFAKSIQGSFSTTLLDDDRILGIFAQIIYTIVIYIILRIRIHKKGIQELIMYIVAVEAVVMCSFLLEVHGTSDYSNLYGGPSSVKEETKIVNRLKKEDPSYYRLFTKSANRDAVNLGMIEGYNGVGTFHSVYNYELNDFLSWSHVTYSSSGWTMGVHEKRINLDTFLGIKYYILPSDDTNVPFGFEECYRSEDKAVYRNKNHIELGFAFDSLISEEGMSSSSFNHDTIKNEILYLTGGILDNKDIEEINQNHSFTTYSRQGDVLDLHSQLYEPRIYRSDVHIYKACWDRVEQGVFDGFLQEDGSIYNDGSDYGDYYVNYSQDDATGLKWNSYMEVYPSSYNRIAPEASSRGGAFVTVKQRMGENLNIILYGEDDKVLTSDRHMIHWYNKEYDYKYERGFYVNEEVKRIEIRLYDTCSPTQYLVMPYVSFEYYDSYKARMDYLKKYEFEEVKKGINGFSFKTNYAEERFIVTQVPYDAGWKLKVKDENGKNINTKIYSAQGGFVSFVAPQGEIYYELNYVTPGLSTGCLGLLIGIFMFSAMYYSIEVIQEEKRRINKALFL